MDETFAYIHLSAGHASEEEDNGIPQCLCTQSLLAIESSQPNCLGIWVGRLLTVSYRATAVAFVAVYLRALYISTSEYKHLCVHPHLDLRMLSAASCFLFSS